jgi:hypothetical protein
MSTAILNKIQPLLTSATNLYNGRQRLVFFNATNIVLISLGLYQLANLKQF